MPDIREEVDLIREVFTYTERFRGSTFIIKIANEIFDHPDFPQHAGDLALLHKAGIHIVIIPDARNRIDEVLNRYGVKQRFENGIRVSDPDSIDLIKMAAFDMAHRIMTALSGHGITAVTGNWIRSRSMGVIDGIDYLRTGTVDQVRIEAVVRTLNQGAVAIFPCVGHNDIGTPFNLSSEELTVSVAAALHAKKIFHLGTQPIMRTPDWKVPVNFKVLDDGRIFRVTPSSLREILSLNPDCPDQAVLKSAIEASEAGVDRIHILDGRQPGVLLKEIFSNLGAGTMVFASDYERIRKMTRADVPGVLDIIGPLVSQGVLVERTREDLEKLRDDYWVYAMDGVVHGCAALHPRGGNCAEIAAVAVDPHYAQLGIGSRLISHLTEQAVEEGITCLFVLTTRTADWFLTLGFREASMDDLPPEKLAVYDTERNSRILVKNLL